MRYSYIMENITYITPVDNRQERLMEFHLADLHKERLIRRRNNGVFVSKKEMRDAIEAREAASNALRQVGAKLD